VPDHGRGGGLEKLGADLRAQFGVWQRIARTGGREGVCLCEAASVVSARRSFRVSAARSDAWAAGAWKRSGKTPFEKYPQLFGARHLRAPGWNMLATASRASRIKLPARAE
jgi:hypothetical protein